MIIKPVKKLCGEITVPGDKSISHRAIMVGALASGTTRVKGFLMGEDCLSTIQCFRDLGVKIEINDDEIVIHGNGFDGLKPSKDHVCLNTGNSGTTTRLLAGILAGRPFSATMSGDESLNSRPMKRIIAPLREMGAQITARDDNFCPLSCGGSSLKGISYTLPVASAQLKSALIFAALSASGSTTITEIAPSRNHTELMLQASGAPIKTEKDTITIDPDGDWELKAQDIEVPGDISSAAFFLVAGCILPDTEIKIRNVGINPTRTGILDVLEQMGADITIENERECSGERVGDLVVRSSKLRSTTVGGAIIPRLIDEIPVIAVAAAFAEGRTVIKDAQELKVKESNRIAAVVNELKKTGIKIEETEDGMIIEGTSNSTPPKGATFETYKDHRMAMSLAVLALGCDGESEILDSDVVAISYPNFFDQLNTLKG